MLGGYYRFYPGDYLRDTSGLSLIEHGAYNLLLHNYYSTEGCLAGEKPRLYRLCGATSPDEQRAVDYVIDKFFPINQGRLTNKRADREMESRKQFLEEQARKGRLGGRPRKNPDESRGKAGAKAGEKPKGKPEESLPGPGPGPGPVPDPLPVPDPVPEKDQERIVPRPGNGRFTPPTLEEVSEYCKSRGNNIDPVKFHAHYTANGWRVGKNPMKVWKAAVVTWERGNI
jgi:uncharacterized protein YdaU (DUF1376 family)